jgi:hypothetical protein
MTIFLVRDGHGYGEPVKAFYTLEAAQAHIQEILSEKERLDQSLGYSCGYCVESLELI